MELLQYLAIKNIEHTNRVGILEVCSSLDLSSQPDVRLPTELAVVGDLNLANSRVHVLPERLFVKGSLDVSNTPIRFLSQSMRIGGSISLRGCHLHMPPEFFDVGGDLDLSEAHIPGLLHGLRVRGSLNMYHTRMKQLPDDLVVDGVLYLVGCRLEKLPRNLKVMKDLVISKSTIAAEPPRDLHVGGKLVDTETDLRNGFIRDGIWISSDSEANTIRATLL